MLLTHLPKQNPLLHLLLQPLTQQKPYNRQLDNILKDYYSKRLTLLPHDYQNYLKKIYQQSGIFKQQDHRWQSLTQNVQIKLKQFNNKSKVYMLKGLVDMDSKVALVKILVDDFGERIGELDIEEVVVLLWCIGKYDRKGKMDMILSLFQRVNQIILTTQQPIVLGRINNPQPLQTKQNTLTISPTIITMLITSMSTLSIVDKPLLKKITKDIIIPNINIFHVNTLVIFFVGFDKLGLRNKRAHLYVYKAIRNKYRELEVAPVQTLVNLAFAIAYLSQRTPSVNQQQKLQKYQDQRTKKQREKKDMESFFLWTLETILLRQPLLNHSKSALLLLYSSKMKVYDSVIWKKLVQNITISIMDANVTDLVMALKSIALLTRDKRQNLGEEEAKIAKRLWQLEDSISGQSLTILGELTQKKRIRPPTRLAKAFQQHLASEETRKMERRRVQRQGRQKQEDE